MEFDRRSFIGAALALGAFAATPALAQVAGKDYTAVTPPQPTEDAGKIEVIEFFSYGCPHCADFNPLLAAWVAKLPADVTFRKVPVSFGRAAWANIAKLYYALEITGDQKRLDSDIFRAIHGERANLFDEGALTAWVVGKGVNEKKFTEAFKSFGIASRVNRGDQMAQAYKITGVPSLAVNGKYLVGGRDFNDTIEIADKLVAKARAERPGKK